MVNEIYEREKQRIFSDNRIKLRTFHRITILWTKNSEFVDSLEVLFNLKIEDLLKAFLNDDTNELLVFLLFSYQNYKKVLIFSSISSLYSSRTKAETRKEILMSVLKNFNIFLLNGILNSKPSNWTNSGDSLEGFKLLNLYRTLWYTKIRPLRRLIKSPKVDRIEKIIEEKFIFIPIFLNHSTEDLLDWEFPNLLLDVQGYFREITPSIRKFSFLSDHFKMQLKDVERADNLSMFQRLSSKSSEFLRHFLYFNDCKFWENSFGELFLSSVRSTVQYHLVLGEGNMEIFSKTIYNSFKNYDELRILVKKIIDKA
jgi:hypothetical protein